MLARAGRLAITRQLGRKVYYFPNNPAARKMAEANAKRARTEAAGERIEKRRRARARAMRNRCKIAPAAAVLSFVRSIAVLPPAQNR